jgi:hypothetical protein
METFGKRLHRTVAERGPLCVGIDPHPALLERWGLDDDVASLPFLRDSARAASASLSQLSDSHERRAAWFCWT